MLDALRRDWDLGPDELALLETAAGSDAYWMAEEFGREHDPAGLFCEMNVRRYRPLPQVTVRVATGGQATPFALARVLLAAVATGAGRGVTVSLHPAAAGGPVGLPDIGLTRESGDELVSRLRDAREARVRLLGDEPALDVLEPAVHVDARPPVLLGRVELLRYLREQTLSWTEHRFGSVVPPPDARPPRPR
jgi:RHH-type proline utilization regulon transcriptional repressor/proline dehydrogenase/delta 1-pyrroline-5-carboxylate dehydrogenase